MDEPAMDYYRLDITRLIPTDHKSFYAWNGSMIQPPCSEGVKWLMLDTTQVITKAQLEPFLKIYGQSRRPVQEIYYREITFMD